MSILGFIVPGRRYMGLFNESLGFSAGFEYVAGYLFPKLYVIRSDVIRIYVRGPQFQGSFSWDLARRALQESVHYHVTIDEAPRPVFC